jgi:hypothetical protein
MQGNIIILDINSDDMLDFMEKKNIVAIRFFEHACNRKNILFNPKILSLSLNVSSPKPMG